MNIYCGNLTYTCTEDELREVFGAHGQVDDVRIITDKFSGRSKGFGFVDMPNEDEAQAAISTLNGKDMGGRELKVNVARPREERGGGGGGGGGRW